MYPLDVFVGFFALFFDPPKKNMSNKTPQSSKERTSSADLIAVGGPLESDGKEPTRFVYKKKTPRKFPSKSEWDLPNGPLTKLLELLDTKV